MDLVACCKDKLAYFRIKELKDVLTQLGLSKQGKKQDLVDRILAILTDEQASKVMSKKNAIGKEEVAKLVDDIFRKMQVTGASDLATKGKVGADSGIVKIKGEIEDPFQSDIKVRCACGSSLQTDSMIKCEDLRCHVWQHVGCVIIPEKPTDGSPPLPDIFYCEVCRLSRADPFLVTVAHPLYPVKLAVTTVPNDGSNPVQSMERTFQITRADKELLAKQEYDVQAWCMLLNDKVLFRMQWPQYADLQVNGVPVRAINRPGSQLLGANGRDDGPIITPWTRDGINKISLSGCDARIFCFGVRIVKRRTIQQVLNIIPKEHDGESFEDALARVCRCVGGANGTDDADSDSDIEVVADFFGVNLRCPMSGSRMKIAGRFKPCAHLGCFDLEVFVALNQRSRKWQCPICLKNYSLENMIIDPYFNRISSKMSDCDEDVTELEVKPDGSWRVKSKSESERKELGDLARWHLPDGSLCPSTWEVKPKVEFLSQVKQEGCSDGSAGLKLGIRKNRNGFWEVSKPENANGPSSGHGIQEKLGYQEPNIIPMSSSATESGRDGDDLSVNQDGAGNFDFANNRIELDSMNVDSAYDGNQSRSAKNAEVIVLSDSDEEHDMIISSGPTYNGKQTDGGINFSLPPSVVNTYNEDPSAQGGADACLGLFNSNNNDFDIPLWPMPPEAQGGPGFQLFTSEANVTDAMVDLQHVSVSCPLRMDGYSVAPETTIGVVPMVSGSADRSDADENGSLVANPLAFSRDDPSLQIFLPTRPSDGSAQSDLRDQVDVANGRDDWISLRLGDSNRGHNRDTAAPNGFNSNQQAPSREGASNSLTATASLLLGMNGDKSEKAGRPRSESPFSFPRKKRSARLYLSIDSDSE